MEQEIYTILLYNLAIGNVNLNEIVYRLKELRGRSLFCIYLIPAFPPFFSNNREFFIDRICFFYLLLSTEQVRAKIILWDALKIISLKDPVQFIYKERTFQPRGVFDKATMSRLHTSYAAFLQESGKMSEALDYHQKALNLFKYNYRSAVNLIELYKQKGQSEKARNAFEALKNLHLPEKCLKECEKLLK